MLLPLPLLFSLLIPYLAEGFLPSLTHVSKQQQLPRSSNIDTCTSSPPALRIQTNSVRCNESRQSKANNPFSIVEGPPPETKPDYNEIIGPLGATLDKLFLVIFRNKMAQQIGKQYDSKLPYHDYDGLMELASTMNKKYSTGDVQLLSQNILKSLFPSWLPDKFGNMFAKPFPAFSARMNAWATYTFGIWLMGECEVNDCKIDGDSLTGDDQSGIQQGLLVKRCRFLEESGCASVCVNSCKIPTQNFFMEDMGLPLTMTPDYETFECQFSFGLTPTLEAELLAKSTPCLGRCPSSGAVRKRHLEDQKENILISKGRMGEKDDGRGGSAGDNPAEITTSSAPKSDEFCFMMDD